MEQNQHPQTWDQAASWLESGELEYMANFKDDWKKADKLEIYASSKREHFRRKPALRPLTAEEIKRGPVEFWALIEQSKSNNILCYVSSAYSSEALARATVRSENAHRYTHFREVLPPMPLSESETVEWVTKFTGLKPYEAPICLDSFIKFFHARECARFEKGKV